MEIFVIKANGEREPFDEGKVRRTLRRIKSPKELEDAVVKRVRERIYDGIRTSEIYSMIIEELKRARHPSAERIALKQAIMSLGPSGFPFEGFVAEVFRTLGRKPQLNVILRGRCVNHEIDILLDDDGIVECKYHNLPGIYTGLKEALYTTMRGIDLREGGFEVEEVWLVTNTKFSLEAKDFARCMGLNLFGWHEPPGEGLEDVLERFGLYPITMIPSLTKEEMRKLAAEGKYTVRSILESEVRTIEGSRLGELRKEAIRMLEG